MIRFGRDMNVTRFVEGERVFAEVSFVRRRGVYIFMSHHRTAINGHMDREAAVELRDALTAAIDSHYWDPPSRVGLFDDTVRDQ